MNSLGQQELVNVVYAYNLPILGALTTNPCTLKSITNVKVKSLTYRALR